MSSLISPMKSISVRSAPRRLASASSLPGIFTATGTKYSALFNWKKFTSIAMVISVTGFSSISASSSCRSLSAAVKFAERLVAVVTLTE